MIETSIGDISEEDFVRKSNEGTLPENIYIKENLILQGCTSLMSLPEGLLVGGGLDLLGCTALTSLPKGLQIGRSLFLQGCTYLTDLPEGLKVGRILDISQCTSLTSLPKGLQVEWKIFADESLIRSFPFKDLPKILHLPFTERLKNVLRERLQ